MMQWIGLLRCYLRNIVTRYVIYMAKANQWFREGRYGNTFHSIGYERIPIEDRKHNNDKWRQVK